MAWNVRYQNVFRETIITDGLAKHWPPNIMFRYVNFHVSIALGACLC